MFKNEPAIKNLYVWQDAQEWKEVFLSIDRVAENNIEFAAKLNRLAEQIKDVYEKVSEPISDLCSVTCTVCEDICCIRATLWFDFKDLLYLYFSGAVYPEHQIYKKGTPFACCHLSESGCQLSRTERPFVCTWYLCTAQKAMLKKHEFDRKQQVNQCLEQLKLLRDQLENQFIKICSNSIGNEK